MTLRTSGSQILIENAAGVTKFNSSDKLVYPRAILSQNVTIDNGPNTFERVYSNLGTTYGYPGINNPQNNYRWNRNYKAKILEWLPVGQEVTSNDFIDMSFRLISSNYPPFNSFSVNKLIPFNSSIIIQTQSRGAQIEGNSLTFFLSWQLWESRKILLTVSRVDYYGVCDPIVSTEASFSPYNVSLGGNFYYTIYPQTQGTYGSGWSPNLEWGAAPITFQLIAKLYTSQ